MSSRNRRPGTSSTGVGTPYKNIFDLVRDRQQMELLADALDVAHRNVRKDNCGQWSILGKQAQAQTFGDLSSYLLGVFAYSLRKWRAIKRKAKAFGWELTQDGDEEGCFRFSLPNGVQSDYLRTLLGLRRRRQPRSDEIVDNEGVSST